MLRQIGSLFLVLTFWGMLNLGQVYAQGAAQVSSVSPTPYSMQNTPTTGISVLFNTPMNASTFQAQNLRVYGEYSGYHSGVLSYTAGTQTVGFTPDVAFEDGEMVTVILTQGITEQNGTPLTASFQWSFYIRSQPGTAEFNSDATYTTGNGPHFIGVGQLDTDADLDIAIPNSKSHEIYTFSNSGTGTFIQGDVVGVSESPRSLTIGDFNIDGDLDIAVTGELDSSIVILDNNGSGSFSTSNPLRVDRGPVYLATNDLNGDGFLDLVSVNEQSNSVSILLNDGNGSFQNRTNYAAGTAPQAVFIADFNRDGFLDLVVTNQTDNNVSLLLNDGSGAFPSLQPFPVGAGPRGVTGQDFNGDGFVDLAVANGAANTISILLNNGGSFAPKTDYPVGTTPFSIRAGDWDGDADADMVATSQGSNQFHVFLNNGTGAMQLASAYPTQSTPRAINFGDFNGDGVMDLAVANWGDNNFQTFLNTKRQVQNQPPAAPTLLNPPQQAFLNPDSGAVVLNWSVPTDADGDSLNFRIDIALNPAFAPVLQTIDSREDVTGFTPPPPVAQNISDVSYTLRTPLADGVYWWRVTAHDGTDSTTSTSRKFVIDATTPNINELTLTPPDLSPNWYNPNLTTSIDLSVQYDETHASKAEFDLGILGGIQENLDIPSGANQSVQTAVNLTDASDGSYSLTASIVDSAGNQTSANTEIALDGTPPTGTQASSPATSEQLDFLVSWSGGSDGSGSGLSGRYDVRVQINGGPWTDWLTNFQGASETYSGENGNSYGFEAVAYDGVGNREIFSEVAESVTSVDTLAGDVTAPGPPPSLAANGSNPSPWENSPNFVIAWQEPADASGIRRALFKVGNAPNANFDTTGSVSSETSYTLEVTQENGQNFYLWFEDGNGNVDFQNHGMVTLRYDATPPTGTRGSSPDTTKDVNFQVSWGGTGDDDGGSGLNGFYDVRLQINGGAFTDWLTNFQGTSQNYQGEHGNTYGFEVAAHDSAGNIEAFSGMAESETVVDTTSEDVTAPGPPLNLLADGSSPSPWKNTTDFQISWEAPTDRSGIKRALYKLGAPPTANEDISGSATGITTVVTAMEENGQALYLWFEDGQGNADFRNNRSVILRYDKTPPTGAQASAPDTAGVIFLVTWQGTGSDGDGSGLSGLYDFRYQVNGGSWLDFRTDFQGTSIQFQGEADSTYGFEVAAHDVAGNVEEFSEVAEATTVVIPSSADSEAPTISHIPPSVVDQGQSVTILAEIRDNMQIVEANLFYKKSGETEFQSMLMVNAGGDNYTASLTAPQISSTGINYFIRASDGVNFTYQPAANWETMPYNLAVRISGPTGEGLLRNEPQPGGDQAGAYRMISIPLNLDNPNPLAVLADELGDYDRKEWRLYQYNAVSDSYTEFPDVDAFSPGTALWLIVRQSNISIDSGTGRTVATNQPFEITLEEGWNDFGIPFGFAVNWDDVQIIGNPDDVVGPYIFEDQWLLPTAGQTLRPWEGYTVFNRTAGTKLAIPPIASGTQSQSLFKMFPQADWFIRISAECNGLRDEGNFLGAAPHAAVEWDKLDYLEPPYISDHVSVGFPHPDWQTFPGLFTTEFKPTFSDGAVWRFAVTTSLSNSSVTLSFTNWESLPNNFRAILVDKSTLEHIDIQEVPSYTFVPDQNSLQRTFDLLIGTPEYLDHSDAAKDAIPESFSISQNYPNPFNAGTTLVYRISEPSHVSIRVLNILGQSVRQLVSEHQTPGSYRIHWDGKSDDGRDMGSGIYIIRFAAGKFQQIRKMLLIR